MPFKNNFPAVYRYYILLLTILCVRNFFYNTQWKVSSKKVPFMDISSIYHLSKLLWSLLEGNFNFNWYTYLNKIALFNTAFYFLIMIQYTYSLNDFLSHYTYIKIPNNWNYNLILMKHNLPTNHTCVCVSIPLTWRTMHAYFI